MKSIIINIGDELLIGQVVNTNASWLGERLHEAGIEVDEIIMIQDEMDAIKNNLHQSLEKAELIIFTGGLGPTKDDITKKALAEYFNVEMVFDEETHERIQKLFERLGRQPTESHKWQCYMPENAQLLKNKMGTAPGMWFDLGEKVVISLPGVPYEMKWIYENGLMALLVEKFHTQAIFHKTIRTIGLGEAKIAERIDPALTTMPDHLKIAYLPNLGSVRLRITGKGTDLQKVKAEVMAKVEEISKLIPDLIFGFDKLEFEEYLGQMLKERKLTIATAESCTGGYIGSRITSIAGSSNYFLGGIISYSNEMKQRQLGVKEETLLTFGAVSEETVREMLKGLLNIINADIGIAVSGIAGPGGGTPEKPVGTIWLAVGSKERIVTSKLQLGKNRITNIQYSSLYALNMVRKFLLAQ